MNGNDITRIKITAKNLPTGQTNWEYVGSLSDDEIEQLAMSDADVLPTSLESLQNFTRSVDVKTIRKNLALSQEEFAYTFHLPLTLLRGWEQKRIHPDHTAYLLLKVIAHNPEVVKQALSIDRNP